MIVRYKNDRHILLSVELGNDFENVFTGLAI
jgi:hypothetical protein